MRIVNQTAIDFDFFIHLKNTFLAFSNRIFQSVHRNSLNKKPSRLRTIGNQFKYYGFKITTFRKKSVEKAILISSKSHQCDTPFLAMVIKKNILTGYSVKLIFNRMLWQEDKNCFKYAIQSIESMTEHSLISWRKPKIRKLKKKSFHFNEKESPVCLHLPLCTFSTLLKNNLV